MKHVGKMKNNGAKVVVVYRTLPGDPYSALIVGTSTLEGTYHNSLMDLIQESSGQQANELAEILAVRKFPDGSTMLPWLHMNGKLTKVPTENVLMTPTPTTSLPLNELNLLIAEQKGVTIEDLSIANEDRASVKSANKPEPIKIVEEKVESAMTPAELRSKADSLFKEAQKLRKKADDIDPPKKKVKQEKIIVDD